jgi:predicted component of type VI protein secretion system
MILTYNTTDNTTVYMDYAGRWFEKYGPHVTDETPLTLAEVLDRLPVALHEQVIHQHAERIDRMLDDLRVSVQEVEQPRFREIMTALKHMFEDKVSLLNRKQEVS